MNDINKDDLMEIESLVFKRLTKPIKTIKLKDIGDHPDFDFEPLYINNQIGIQTIDLRELDEWIIILII